MDLERSYKAILQALHDAGIGLERGVNLFAGPLRPGKSLACFVQSTGGQVQWLLSHDAQTEIATAQVSVWSPQDQAQAGWEIAYEALHALHASQIGGYYLCKVREAEPAPIGRDDSGRNGYSFNVELHGLRT